MITTHPPDISAPPGPDHLTVALRDVSKLAPPAAWVDRLSLHIGLWLLLRSTRRTTVDGLHPYEQAGLRHLARTEHEEHLTAARVLASQLSSLR